MSTTETNVHTLTGQEDRHKPAALSGHDISDILGGADGDLGLFLQDGGGHDCRGAIDNALRSANALTDVLSTIDDDAISVREDTRPGSIGRLAWLAQTMIERAIVLREHEAANAAKESNHGE